MATKRGEKYLIQIGVDADQYEAIKRLAREGRESEASILRKMVDSYFQRNPVERRDEAA